MQWDRGGDTKYLKAEDVGWAPDVIPDDSRASLCPLHNATSPDITSLLFSGRVAMVVGRRKEEVVAKTG